MKANFTMEVEAVTHVAGLLQEVSQTTHAISLTDSVSLQKTKQKKGEKKRSETLKAKSGLISPDWHVSMFDIHLQKLLWMYCRGHAQVKGNNRTN